MRPRPWQLWIDTGGTFTDCIGIDPVGRSHRVKVLSSGAVRVALRSIIDSRTVVIDPPWELPDGFFDGFIVDQGEHHSGHEVLQVTRSCHDGTLHLSREAAASQGEGSTLTLRSREESPILAARVLTRTAPGQPLPPIHMRLATTRATNALLERRGGRVALFITRGFGDLLLIGDQTRPDLFSLTARRPDPLYQCVHEVEERLAADGAVLRPLDEEALRESARAAKHAGAQCAAIAFLHADINPDHEDRAEAILRETGFQHVSKSSAVSPFIKILHRAETTVANAFVAPVMEEYTARVRAALSQARDSRLRLLTSAGGLMDAADVQPKDCLLSGPAGGVVGAAKAGEASGFDRIIGFDMGGTSTDVCRYDGRYDYRFEQHVGDARIIAPALAIETVAAGGGSICAWKFARLQVGPESAGADPGPACYGRGGPLTLTDVNLLLGRINAARFEIPLDVSAAERAFADVRHQVERETNAPIVPEELLEGFLAFANERMAGAIERVSLRRGFDARDYALVAFGGAGGQHACRVAQRLGMEKIILPPDAALLSAVGLGFARLERFAERQVLRPLEEIADEFAEILRELEARATGEVEREGVERNEIAIDRRIVTVRLEGQESALQIEGERCEDIQPLFERAYRERYGHAPAGKAIEVESVRVVAAAGGQHGRLEAEPAGAVARAQPPEPLIRRSFIGGEWRDVPVIERASLRPDRGVVGPALIVERSTTLVIEAHWYGTVDAAGAIVLQLEPSAHLANSARARAAAGRVSRGAADRELFAHRFTAIAEEMGEMLERTALSTNVKERRDFSCALLDDEATLLVNAPHIPVHLGSLGICVRAVRDRLAMGHGDAVVTNHPAFGGSHLPDVTIITPSFDDAGRLLGYAASRAHHAEIGGARPGSMPPDARCLQEEGVVIPPMHLVRGGESCFDDVEALLRRSPHPSRAVADNLADMRAALAANRRGAEALRSLARAAGSDEVRRRMIELRDHAAALAGAAIERLGFQSCSASDALDDGSPIAVRLTRHRDHLHIDFAGSAARHPGNLNATPAIVHSAVIYVLRVLIGEGLPLNEGIMRQVSIAIPAGILNPPFDERPERCPAVVGGNTEVSQRVVDVLLKALGVCAASQGTMNNIIFGNGRFGYYETVCGGAGAGPDFDGADAVQCHMTNTRMTDPEVLERRYPARLHRFAMRRGSGGAGGRDGHSGGDGVVRELEFLQPVALSVLTQRRTLPPWGLAGGESGKTGAQMILRADGTTLPMRSIDGCDVATGDRLILETPGGGGYGKSLGRTGVFS